MPAPTCGFHPVAVAEAEQAPLTYSDLMEAGELIGPRLYSTGPGVFSNDNIRSLDDARDVLRRYANHYNTQTIKQYLAGDRKVRQWVIMAAHELGLTPTPTFIVAYGGPSGRQYYLTHTNVDAEARLRTFSPHDELDKWKSTQWYRDDQYVHFLYARQLDKWVDGGAKAGLGSHGEVQGLGTAAGARRGDPDERREGSLSLRAIRHWRIVGHGIHRDSDLHVASGTATFA